MVLRPEPFHDRDIIDEEDVLEVMTRFYGKVAQDDLIGPMYNDVAKVDWSEHIPKTARFWNSILFGGTDYTGSPKLAHERVNAKRRFTHEMFQRWYELFSETVDNGWKGNNAETMKRKAKKSAIAISTMLIGTPAQL